MSITEQVADLQARIAAAQKQRFRAEAARDAAQARAAEAREELQRDFGVTSVEQAAAKLEELKAELHTAVSALHGELERIGV